MREENANLRRHLNNVRNEASLTSQTHRLRINTIESEKAVMREELETLEQLVERLKEDKKDLKRDLRDAEDKIENLKEDKKSLKRSIRDRPDLPKLFHGNYE